MTQQLTRCTFCGVGCGLYLEISGNQVVGACSGMLYPANEGRICLRGSHGDEVISSPDRLKNPLLGKNGRSQEMTWSDALGYPVFTHEPMKNLGEVI